MCGYDIYRHTQIAFALCIRIFFIFELDIYFVKYVGPLPFGICDFKERQMRMLGLIHTYLLRFHPEQEDQVAPSAPPCLNLIPKQREGIFNTLCSVCMFYSQLRCGNFCFKHSSKNPEYNVSWKKTRNIKSKNRHCLLIQYSQCYNIVFMH